MLFGQRSELKHQFVRCRLSRLCSRFLTLLCSTSTPKPRSRPPLPTAVCLASQADAVPFTRDEGRPFGFGDHVAGPSHCKLLSAQGGERCTKVGTMIPAGKVERGERKQTAFEASKSD
jgi:hypothetical protein